PAGANGFALIFCRAWGRTHRSQRVMPRDTDGFMPAAVSHAAPEPQLSAFSNEENGTVKRTVCLAAGLVALGVVIYVGKLWAQQPGAAGATPAAAPEPRTRIALLNLNYVIKFYKKFNNYQEQLKHDAEP